MKKLKTFLAHAVLFLLGAGILYVAIDQWQQTLIFLAVAATLGTLIWAALYLEDYYKERR